MYAEPEVVVRLERPGTDGIEGLESQFFTRPAELVASELNGCLLVKRQADGALLWGYLGKRRRRRRTRPPAMATAAAAPATIRCSGNAGVCMWL